MFELTKILNSWLMVRSIKFQTLQNSEDLHMQYPIQRLANHTKQFAAMLSDFYDLMYKSSLMVFPRFGNHSLAGDK